MGVPSESDPVMDVGSITMSADFPMVAGSRDGAAPVASEAGLKDTVVVRPGETVGLIMRFIDDADPATAYRYHCHLLNHEDNGMMGQFVVV